MSDKQSEVNVANRENRERQGDSASIADNCGCFHVVDACGCRVVDPCNCYVSQCCC